MPRPTVLITGLNSFVAVHTALHFLQQGWNVRGSVRSEAKGKHVLSLPALQPYKDKLSYVVVESLEDGDFTEALRGVAAVSRCPSAGSLLIPQLAHVASPFHFKGKTWDDYGEPAIKGTNNVLGQAAKGAQTARSHHRFLTRLSQVNQGGRRGLLPRSRRGLL